MLYKNEITEKMKRIFYLLFASVIMLFSCKQPQTQAVENSINVKSWQQKLDAELPLLGHRNWILIVDKAFPSLNAPGMEVMYADSSLLGVLKYTLQAIDSSSHVKPIIYVDKEMQSITPQMEDGVNVFRDSLISIVGNVALHSTLHDSVFTTIQKTAELFKVLVIKTNSTLAYSSVFLQLDCAYWTAEKEDQLRNAMKGGQLVPPGKN